MGWAEWIIRWAKKKVLVHYQHHKDEVHRLTDILIKEGSMDVAKEFLTKRTDLTDYQKQLILEAVQYISAEVDKRVDDGFDRWVAGQLGEKP